VAQAGNPIRLTSDPTWGSGEAQIYGSETVTGWTRGAHPKMPNGGQVWMKEVDFLPRTLWMTAPNGNATRLEAGAHDELERARSQRRDERVADLGEP
jgi:hypothetical protein